jgi:hypothetical protein
MTLLKFLSLSTLFILVTFSSLAQKNITGTIIDAKTQKPIVHAEVFISGTTTGCISDKLGNFTLETPFFPCILVADHVSYESHVQPLTQSENLQIKLAPSVFSINEVSVSAKNKRKKNLRYFYSRFIKGNKRDIEILNDSVLVFKRDEMQFTAFSTQPLIIENRHLGFRIKVNLEEFKVIARDGPNGKQIPLSSMDGGEVLQLTGYYFYETLEEKYPSKKQAYINNRKQMYYGSYRHFLKSIYNNNPEQHGYEVTTPKANEVGPLFIESKDFEETGYKQFAITRDTINITYHFDSNDMPIPKEKAAGRYYLYTRKSVIYATRTPFIVRENGTSPNISFVIDGMMVSKSFAHSLPDNYSPTN